MSYLNADPDLGFKFIGNTALQLVQEGYEVPFGYEEAIGYMFGNEIRDKDGVAASVSPETCRFPMNGLFTHDLG